MSGLKQPWLGVAATTLVIVLSFLAILPWDYATFGGPVADFMMCMIPFAIVVGAVWQGQEPKPLAGLSQPVRGIAYLVVAALVGAVIYFTLGAAIGGGLGDTPFLTFGIIMSVVVTFFLAIVWGGWPFNLIKNKLASGVALLVGAYVIAALIVRTLFSFAFMGETPPGMDPKGPIAAPDGLVIAITALAVMFLFLHLDLWPFTSIKGIMKQPILGIVWTAVNVVIGWALYSVGTGSLGMNPFDFMVKVPIPFIFGSILLLNMLGGSLTASLKGLAKGLSSAALALVVGEVLSFLYVALMPILTKDVPPDVVPQSLWLANALLAITFPFLAMYGDFFHLWPLAPKAPAPAEEKASAPVA